MTSRNTKPSRTLAAKALDLGQKAATSFLVLGSVYLAVQLSVGFYTVRSRRIAWEAEHPDEVAAFYAKQKADKEGEKQRKLESDRERTLLLEEKVRQEREQREEQQRLVQQQEAAQTQPAHTT